MAINPRDNTRTLPTRRHEHLARLIADGTKSTTVGQLATLTGFSQSTVKRLKFDRELIRRVQFLQAGKLRGLVPKALSALEDLLSSDVDSVRLKAAIEVLDRAGLAIDKPQETHAAFNLTLNLGNEEGLKTATSLGPPPIDEDFSSSRVLPDNLDEDFSGSEVVIEGEEIEADA